MSNIVDIVSLGVIILCTQLDEDCNQKLLHKFAPGTSHRMNTKSWLLKVKHTILEIGGTYIERKEN